MDEIIINDLEVFYHVGVPDAERTKPQRLLLTLTIEHDFRKAARSENLSDTIDYSAICQRLLNFGTNRQWKLIETLASEIAETILKEHPVNAIEVKVKKFIIPEARYVAVSLKRSAN
jgi:7,8-dihydroneopterin aldolase/epimerase/oxygenase